MLWACSRHTNGCRSPDRVQRRAAWRRDWVCCALERVGRRCKAGSTSFSQHGGGRSADASIGQVERLPSQDNLCRIPRGPPPAGPMRPHPSFLPLGGTRSPRTHPSTPTQGDHCTSPRIWGKDSSARSGPCGSSTRCEAVLYCPTRVSSFKAVAGSRAVSCSQTDPPHSRVTALVSTTGGGCVVWSAGPSGASFSTHTRAPRPHRGHPLFVTSGSTFPYLAGCQILDHVKSSMTQSTVG